MRNEECKMKNGKRREDCHIFGDSGDEGLFTPGMRACNLVELLKRKSERRHPAWVSPVAAVKSAARSARPDAIVASDKLVRS
jgi:hypothetical protein